jgi:hypothetical protein
MAAEKSARRCRAMTEELSNEGFLALEKEDEEMCHRNLLALEKDEDDLLALLDKGVKVRVDKVRRKIAIPRASMSVRCEWDLVIWERAVVTIEWRVAYETLGELRHPKTWWDAVKQRFAPKWFLRRWPVNEVVWTARCYYPTVSVPKLRHAVSLFEDGKKRL